MPQQPDNATRLSLSPLSHRVYAGRIKQRGQYAEAVGKRTDVTSDFFDVLIQLAAAKGGTINITSDGGPSYEVTVRELPPADAA